MRVGQFSIGGTYGQKEEVKPERHAEMSLVGKWQGGITDTLKIGNGILEDRNIVRHPSCNRRCDIGMLHAAYNKRVNMETKGDIELTY